MCLSHTAVQFNFIDKKFFWLCICVQAVLFAYIHTLIICYFFDSLISSLLIIAIRLRLASLNKKDTIFFALSFTPDRRKYFKHL
jgi:hypothetical protein